MHPGEEKSEQTFSYHRSLQDFFKALAKNGFVVSRLEEWISHKISERGPRQAAEDIARKEIPLFLMLEAKILPSKKIIEKTREYTPWALQNTLFDIYLRSKKISPVSQVLTKRLLVRLSHNYV